MQCGIRDSMREDIGEVVITDIQRFSLGDGPGIRTTIFFKGCNLHCPWCHNPETISPDVEMHYGRRCSTAEVLAQIMEDREFYWESGGGVTLSGGEPLLQAGACAELASACQQADIPVLLDTAGNVELGRFEKVLPYLSQCYFDLKSGTEEGYASVGGCLSRTLENIRVVVRAGIPTVARIPIIPGFNDSIQAAQGMAEVLSGTGIRRVDLLPFHRMGSGKYRALGKEYLYTHTLPIEPKQLEPLLDVFRMQGFCAVGGG